MAAGAAPSDGKFVLGNLQGYRYQIATIPSQNTSIKLFEHTILNGFSILNSAFKTEVILQSYVRRT